MKKVLSLVLVLAMVLGSFSFVSAAKYEDVDGTNVATAVDRLSTLGILEGYPDGTFKPDNSITRAEFSAVAVRAKGLESVAQAAKGLATGFNDVPATHWASGYVGTASKAGVVNGMGWGQFLPEAPVKYEDAVTMIVRALGYEAAAQAKGGYPYGYLIVANEIGLLDAVKGTQGVAATRGIVAQIVDNALEIPMMIQVGFGSDVKWVISGSKEHGGDEAYLLDSMGFDSVEGRVVAINTKTNKVTVDPTDEDLKNVTLNVAEGFDFYGVEGLETKFWSKDDKVVVYVVNEEAKFDAVKVDKDELTLVVEDENYEVARGAVLTVNGDKVAQKDFVADYAKVVLNDDNEIIWAQGYTLDGFILVEEVKEEVAYSYNEYDELDLEDFTVVKEGKTIAIDAIAEEDVLFFNADEEFAVVYNKGTEGELDRVYSDGTFRFEGKGYSLSDIAATIYFDEGKVGELDATILDDFLDDEATITVFVDFAGKAVVVAGEVNSVGNSAYSVVTADAVPYAGRKGQMLAIDVRNGANEKVSYDLLVADLGKDIKLTNITKEEVLDIEKADNVVLKITVDKDGDVTGIELPEQLTGANKFETDDANVKVGGVSYKLQSNTIVFYDSNKKADTIANAKDKFSEVKAGATIYVEKGRVIAVVGETDTDADTKVVAGLVTGVKELTNGKLQFTVSVSGSTQRLVTESKTLKLADFADYEDTIRGFEVGETSGEIKDFETVSSRTLDINSISGRTIKAKSGADVELNSKAVIYDAELETMNLRELKKNDTITVYFQGSSNRFVDYVIIGEVETLPPVKPGEELAVATKAVEKAEASKLQEDVDAARALVNKLAVSEESSALKVRLNKIVVVTPPVTTKTGVKATGAVTTQGVDNAAEVPEVPATIATKTIDADIVLTAQTEGKAGNDITITVVQQTGDSKEIEVKVVGKNITVNLATDAAGNAMSTKEEVVAAINDNKDASALVVATGGSTDVANPVARVALAGGKDLVALKPEVTAVAEVYTLTITNGATATGTISVNGTDVDVTKDMTPAMVAQAINAVVTEAGYTVTVDGAKVIFTATTAGVKADLAIKVVDK